MNWNLLIDKTKKHCQKELPFVIYKKPNAIVVQSFFQKTSASYSCNYLEDGFVFAPFSKEHQTFFLPRKESDCFEIPLPKQTEISTNNRTVTSNKNAENQHINLVEKGIKSIEQQEFQKVVLSRKEEILLADFDVFTYFQKLVSHYASAFVYVWYHPKTGYWIGATPEQLVSATKESFYTMALAGTQLYKEGEEAVWQSKELEEQQIVTDYIVSKLKAITKEVKTSKVKTVRAGNLLHLQTDINGNLGVTSFKEIVQQLHPTPAVCGFRTEKAQKFIKENESYDREYYTGFLGEIDLKNTSQLFVNLRCMKFYENTASVYVGGGITASSDPRKEWEETVHKLGTIVGLL